jgi:hypothetical protein
MRRVASLLFVAALVGASGAAAGHDWVIRSNAIGGAHLGKPKAYYVGTFGTSYRTELLENGYSRLSYKGLRLEVYFKQGRSGAVAIVSWNKRFKTPEHVGPCSPASALTTYPGAKKVFGGGAPSGNPATVYRLGKLLFDVEHQRIVAVGLGPSRRAVFLTANAPGCR